MTPFSSLTGLNQLNQKKLGHFVIDNFRHSSFLSNLSDKKLARFVTDYFLHSSCERARFFLRKPVFAAAKSPSVSEESRGPLSRNLSPVAKDKCVLIGQILATLGFFWLVFN
jgi:hypothetical protein